jgi:hypothetical protein
LPDFNILKELLFGSMRGLLYTQGWVLAAIASVLIFVVLGRFKKAYAITDRLLRDSAIFSFVGLALLLEMNCSFNGWHGGSSAGPRYLSIILPACAVTAGLSYSRAPEFLRQAMVAGLAMATALAILVFGVATILAPETGPLFGIYFQWLLAYTGIPLERTAYLLLAFGWLTYRAIRSNCDEREALTVRNVQSVSIEDSQPLQMAKPPRSAVGENADSSPQVPELESGVEAAPAQ